MKATPVPTNVRRTVFALALALGLPAVHARAETGPDTVTLHVSPERDYLYRRGPREIVLEVDLQAKRPEHARHTPVNVSVVLDHSGSMEGAKMEKARQAACAAVDQLEADDFFSLVVFDTEVELLLPPERAGSADHRAALKERINRVRPRGGTALYGGVKMGGRQVARFLDKERVNRVILISDGLANEGPSSPRELAELGRSLRGDGLSVSTIGLGDDFNEDLMTALAEASRANYYYVKDAEKLPRILADELGEAGARVADNVRVRIEAPVGVRVREVIGHPEISCRERSAEITLPEMFGAEHRLYHLRCAVDEPAATMESLQFADVALSYNDVAAKQDQSRRDQATVRWTDDARRSDESVHDAVARNVGTLQNRLDKEAAIKLADEGHAKEAASLLRNRASFNSAAPASQQISGMTLENSKLNGLADELTSQGTLQKASRKAAQYDNYQDKYQKK